MCREDLLELGPGETVVGALGPGETVVGGPDHSWSGRDRCHWACMAWHTHVVAQRTRHDGAKA